LFKNKPKASLYQYQSEHDGSQATNGRWSEREHYLFLIAVKEYGRDWKKIESFVKTRSSTQARSHAQKVLKDELYANLDEEINRLERLYNFSADIDSEQAKIYFTQTNFQRAPKLVKRRNSKGQSKIEIQGDNKNWIQTPNKYDEFYEMENDSNSQQDDNDDDSEYLYPENLNMKLFTIEKVVKKKPNSGIKRLKFTSNLVHSNRDVMEKRKDSIAVQSSVSTSLSKSPKTDLIHTEGLLKQSQERHQNELALDKSEEKETTSPNNKNGCSQKVVENESLIIDFNRELKVNF
jgi:SHAQKYF class myb-like DNA-binding protein